jgi:hypothetical protein
MVAKRSILLSNPKAAERLVVRCDLPFGAPKIVRPNAGRISATIPVRIEREAAAGV